jgi:hypothetical protein
LASLGSALFGFMAQELFQGALRQITDLALLVDLSQGM